MPSPSSVQLRSPSTRAGASPRLRTDDTAAMMSLALSGAARPLRPSIDLGHAQRPAPAGVRGEVLEPQTRVPRQR
eukprot:4343283-Lingulodinium_polyedra.AAC.1